MSLKSRNTSFNLVIERLLISGQIITRRVRMIQVSISLSSGFSFQVTRHRKRIAQHCPSFNLVIKRLLISGCSGNTLPSGFHQVSFNLVIERLLISGKCDFNYPIEHLYRFNLVIERLLISGLKNSSRSLHRWCFNLVIERLLISGSPSPWRGGWLAVGVSISLSSGFSFQACDLRYA